MLQKHFERSGVMTQTPSSFLRVASNSLVPGVEKKQRQNTWLGWVTTRVWDSTAALQVGVVQTSQLFSTNITLVLFKLFEACLVGPNLLCMTILRIHIWFCVYIYTAVHKRKYVSHPYVNMFSCKQINMCSCMMYLNHVNKNVLDLVPYSDLVGSAGLKETWLHTFVWKHTSA